jgi:hypothetical protein
MSSFVTPSSSLSNPNDSFYPYVSNPTIPFSSSPGYVRTMPPMHPYFSASNSNTYNSFSVLPRMYNTQSYEKEAIDAEYFLKKERRKRTKRGERRKV